MDKTFESFWITCKDGYQLAAQFYPAQERKLTTLFLFVQQRVLLKTFITPLRHG